MIMLQERVQAKDPPSHYLNKLRTYLDPKASRSSRVSEYYIAHGATVSVTMLTESEAFSIGKVSYRLYTYNIHNLILT